MRRLPPIEPLLPPTIEEAERAAIEAEDRGEFGPPASEIQHRQLVSALVRGYEIHKRAR
jgi:hypothetical protein